MTKDKTQFGREGRAPLLTEQFDTVTAIEVTTVSGQLGDVSGLRFHILADPANSNNILIGGESSMTFPLEPGLGITLEVENLDQLYANIQSGDKLQVLVLDETVQD